MWSKVWASLLRCEVPRIRLGSLPASLQPPFTVSVPLHIRVCGGPSCSQVLAGLCIVPALSRRQCWTPQMPNSVWQLLWLGVYLFLPPEGLPKIWKRNSKVGSLWVNRTVVSVVMFAGVLGADSCFFGAAGAAGASGVGEGPSACPWNTQRGTVFRLRRCPPCTIPVFAHAGRCSRGGARQTLSPSRLLLPSANSSTKFDGGCRGELRLRPRSEGPVPALGRWRMEPPLAACAAAAQRRAMDPHEPDSRLPPRRSWPYRIQGFSCCVPAAGAGTAGHRERRSERKLCIGNKLLGQRSILMGKHHPFLSSRLCSSLRE